MTHISHRPMKRKVAQKIQDNFLRALLSGRMTQRRAVLRSLLTQTEKTMVAKRLAVIIMLEQGHAYYRIAKTLKVSVSTCRRLNSRLSSGSYSGVRGSLFRRARTNG